jgi:hypothetical protein
MKAFRNVVVIKQPLDLAWITVRDRLPEIGALIDDIESIVPLERELIAPGTLRLVNEWHAKQSIPAPIKARLGINGVSWLDRNEWNDGTRRCEWRIEPSVLPEHIRCAGNTVYEPVMGGRGTRVTFTGEFELAHGAISLFAGPLALPVLAIVESIVTILIPKNLRKVMAAAEQLIRGRGPA